MQRADKAGLFNFARYRARALPPGRWPPRFTDPDRFACKLLLHLGGDSENVIDCVVHRYRVVLPVGQDVDGDDIDERCQRGVAQPEFPYIRIRYRHRRMLARIGENFAQSFSGKLAAQQHLVTDHQQVHHVQVLTRQRDTACQLQAVLGFIA